MDERRDEGSHCCFDEWASVNAARARKGRTAAITSAVLKQLEDAGLTGRSLLDVGCGSGDLALGALARGAARVEGIDLGTGAIALARELAAERGLAERASFEVGDGSTAPLHPADVVVLNRVVCCYPDATGLLDNALPAAGSVLALSAPANRGVAGLVNRMLTAVSNRWYGLRDAKYRGFRVFLHDLDAIDDRVRAAGFARRHRGRRRAVWEVAVYER
jgi:magnesium-protoporphyrin O-methyltransferase